MELIPFDRAFAPEILPFYINPEYAAFRRAINRFITFDECCNLPQFLGNEVLIAIEDGKFIGVVTLCEEQNKVIKWALAVKAKQLRDGSQAQYLLEQYCFGVRGARLLITEIVDNYLSEPLKKRGYKEVGIIPKRDFVLGEYKDVTIYVKESSWVL